ncbi:MAG: hypothetical protein JWN12_240 [Candidatus Saccharibacteria bacterium]|nr:hypothetical protein [Candidatus Saccharibacteria bacterium]
MNTLLQFAQNSYDYTYTTSNVDAGTAAGISAGIFLFGLIFVVIAYVVSALFLGRIFKKAGIESWIAWVPFYNTWKLLEIGGQQGFWAVLAIIPFVQYVSIVFIFIAMYNIGLKFGKPGAFVVLGIFLPIVWFIWLAVDDSKWNESLGAPSKAVEHTGGTTPPTAPTAAV